MAMRETVDVAAIYPGAARVGEILAILDYWRSTGMSNLDDACYRAGGLCISLYFGAIGHVPHEVATSTLNRSYAVAVTVERPDVCSQGVLIALGHDAGGFVLFVQDNQLVYEYHYVSACYALRSDCTVPTGPSTLQFVFTKTGHLQGVGTLYINDRKVGEAAIPHTLPYYTATAGPVADVEPRRVGLFTGTIKRVMIETVAPPGWSPRFCPSIHRSGVHSDVSSR
ncbi:MAG TPA: hypothetical protein VKF37_12900 [Chloroflexota bacterium]|nr:hypothetical protein [Chloroflexota bacterium]